MLEGRTQAVSVELPMGGPEAASRRRALEELSVLSEGYTPTHEPEVLAFRVHAARLDQFEDALCDYNLRYTLTEGWGKAPQWLKVMNVKSGFLRYGGESGNEVTVRIRGKDYWFPSDGPALRKFLRLGETNRGKALIWYRKYIRRRKHYLGKWPDRTYVMRNKILAKNVRRVAGDEDDPVQEMVNPDSFTGGDILYHGRGGSKPAEPWAYSQLLGLTGLDDKQLRTVAVMASGGQGTKEIARAVGVSLSELKYVLDLMHEYGLFQPLVMAG